MPETSSVVSFDECYELRPTERDGRFRCTFSRQLLAPPGHLQGGAGLGLAIAAMERASGRPIAWATAQYLRFLMGRAELEISVTLEVEGHQTTQARAVIHEASSGDEILMVLGVLGRRTTAFDGHWLQMPDVPRALDCPVYDVFAHRPGHVGGVLDVRRASGRQGLEVLGAPGSADSAMWVRFARGNHEHTPGELTFIGDLLPVGFNEPYGSLYAGSSIDNTLRFGPRSTGEWVLLDCRMEQTANGFGYGRGHLWSERGELLGTASQTMVMRMKDAWSW